MCWRQLLWWRLSFFMWCASVRLCCDQRFFILNTKVHNTSIFHCQTTVWYCLLIKKFPYFCRNSCSFLNGLLFNVENKLVWAIYRHTPRRYGLLRERYCVVRATIIVLRYRLLCFKKLPSRLLGQRAIDSISRQLQKELPGLRGFSATNIKNMRSFYEEWSTIINRYAHPLPHLRCGPLPLSSAGA